MCGILSIEGSSQNNLLSYAFELTRQTRGETPFSFLEMWIYNFKPYPLDDGTSWSKIASSADGGLVVSELEETCGFRWSLSLWVLV